jgi:hypothetical protein
VIELDKQVKKQGKWATKYTLKFSE